MKTLLTFILDRAKERSTWLGMISVATAVGLSLSADQQEAIIALGMALAGSVAVFTRG